MELDSLGANAFAVAGSRTIIFTEGALAAMDDSMLAAITLHELAHLNESRSTVRLRTVSTLTWVPLIAVAPATHEFGPLALVGVGGMALLLTRASLRFRRRLEEHADGAAGDASSKDYARALERLGETNLTPVVLRQRGTHPALYDRLTVLGHPPSFPRPAPPPRPPPLGVCLFLVAVALIVGQRLVHDAALRDGNPTEATRLALLAFGGDEEDLLGIATIYEQQGRSVEAGAFRRASEELRRDQADEGSHPRDEAGSHERRTSR